MSGSKKNYQDLMKQKTKNKTKRYKIRKTFKIKKTKKYRDTYEMSPTKKGEKAQINNISSEHGKRLKYENNSLNTIRTTVCQ